jgi:hypothetical protein
MSRTVRATATMTATTQRIMRMAMAMNRIAVARLPGVSFFEPVSGRMVIPGLSWLFFVERIA